MKRIFDIFPPKKVEEREKIFYPKKEKKFKKIWILFFLIFIFIGVYFLKEFPFAKVKVWPKIETFNFQTDLKIDKEINQVDILKKSIPGKIFEIEKEISGEFFSSGKKFVERKAEGTIRVFNDYHSDQVLIAKTRFQPPLEKFKPPLEKNENPWFRTTERILIPAKGFKDVKVVADSPGEKYNIEPSTFSIPGLAGTPQYTFIYGKSFLPMKGGLKREVLVVRDEDLEKAKDSLTKMAMEKGKEILRESIPSGFSFFEEASKIEILDISFEAKSGQEVEKFSGKAKIRIKALIYLEKEFDEFVKNFVISKIGEKKIKPESLKITSLVKDFDVSLGRISLSIEGEVEIYSQLDEISLKKSIAKKRLEEAKIFLKNQPEIDRFKISIFPFWAEFLPENLERIDLKIEID